VAVALKGSKAKQSELDGALTPVRSDCCTRFSQAKIAFECRRRCQGSQEAQG